jgi:hypothetical protein
MTPSATPENYTTLTDATKSSYSGSRGPQLSNVLVGRGLVCGGRVPGPRSKVARPRIMPRPPGLHARTGSRDLTRATPAVHVAEPGLFARGTASGADAPYIPATAYRPAGQPLRTLFEASSRNSASSKGRAWRTSESWSECSVALMKACVPFNLKRAVVRKDWLSVRKEALVSVSDARHERVTQPPLRLLPIGARPSGLPGPLGRGGRRDQGHPTRDASTRAGRVRARSIAVRTFA